MVDRPVRLLSTLTARFPVMHVLLVAHAFPPDPLVGSIRAHKVAKAFRDAGHQVEVVTARLADERGDDRNADPGLRVYPVKSYAHPVHALGDWRARYRRQPEAAARESAAGAPPSSAKHRPAWKRHLLSVLQVPDRWQGFIGPAFVRSLALVRGGVDLLYTTAPPFSDHLVGLALKQVTGVRWAAEFRDPWTDNPLKAKGPRSREADAIDRWLERRCLAEADHVVAVADRTRELLQAKIPPGQDGKFIVALNGIDAIRPPGGTGHRGTPFRIVHTGSLYQDRDPRPFFRALASVVGRRRFGPADLRVEFVGDCRRYHGVSLHAFTHDVGLADFVSFRDWIPLDETRQLIWDADLLLLLAQNHPHQVLNKVYDYLGARIPILAFVDPDGASTRMLERIGGHYLITSSEPAEVECALEAALDAPPRSPSPDEDALLNAWSSERQMHRLVSMLQDSHAAWSP